MFSVIILAAGLGTRMNNLKKQFFKIGNKMIIEFSVNTFLQTNANEIVIATHPDYLITMKNFFKNNNKIKIVEGGLTRHQSAKNAFSVCNKKNNLVLIHDAARPFIKLKSIETLIKTALKTKAATLANFAPDTIKLVENKTVVKTLNREKIALIQTPQAFNFELYEKAIKLAEKKNQNFTDDCQLIEQLNIPVTIVENDRLNFKITTLTDLQIAEFLATKFNL